MNALMAACVFLGAANLPAQDAAIPQGAVNVNLPGQFAAVVEILHRGRFARDGARRGAGARSAHGGDAAQYRLATGYTASRCAWWRRK